MTVALKLKTRHSIMGKLEGSLNIVLIKNGGCTNTFGE